MTHEQIICVVDDDADVRESLSLLLQRSYRILAFESAHAFLEAGIDGDGACALIDIRMPQMDGLTLQRQLKQTHPGLPVIFMTGHGDVPMAVQAMKEGAIEFLEKPFEKAVLLSALENAFTQATGKPSVAQDSQEPFPKKALTEREKDVFDLLVQGHQNKVVAHKLGISTRTVEVHRGHIMGKLGAKCLADLVWMLCETLRPSRRSPQGPSGTPTRTGRSACCPTRIRSSSTSA